jgi:DNA polymerase-3 subunit gamma/tau
VAAIEGYLSRQVEAEGMRVEPGVLQLIARQATGSLRDAISLLDQLVSTGDAVTADFARAVLGTAAGEHVAGIVQAVAENNVASGLEGINQALDSGADPRQLARQIVEYLRGLLLVRSGNADRLDVPEDVAGGMLPLAEQLSLGDLLSALRAFARAASETRGTWQPGLPLELALVESVRLRVAGQAAGTPPSPAARVGPGPAVGPVSSAAGAGSATGEPPARTAPVPASQSALLERWRDVLKAAYRRDPRAQALLNSCKPLGIEKGNVVLAFSSDLLREKMEKGHNLACVQDALLEVMGEPLGVRCVLTRAPAVKQAAREPEESPPAEPVEEGGMVATAIRDLGAQVIDVKPMPPDGNA